MGESMGSANFAQPQAASLVLLVVAVALLRVHSYQFLPLTALLIVDHNSRLYSNVRTFRAVVKSGFDLRKEAEALAHFARTIGRCAEYFGSSSPDNLSLFRTNEVVVPNIPGQTHKKRNHLKNRFLFRSASSIQIPVYDIAHRIATTHTTTVAVPIETMY